MHTVGWLRISQHCYKPEKGRVFISCCPPFFSFALFYRCVAVSGCFFFLPAFCYFVFVSAEIDPLAPPACPDAAVAALTIQSTDHVLLI